MKHWKLNIALGNLSLFLEDFFTVTEQIAVVYFFWPYQKQRLVGWVVIFSRNMVEKKIELHSLHLLDGIKFEPLHVPIWANATLFISAFLF